MGLLVFFVAVVATCLLWSAAFTAVAARSRPGWIRGMLITVAVIVPPLTLAPWVAFAGWLTASGFQTNWFAPSLTAAISALIGGAWIARAGLAPPTAPAAATWPLVGLAALVVLAKAVAAGTLLVIDNAVAAEGRMLRTEAAQMMATLLPPAPRADDNAAPLYERAFAEIAADTQATAADSPIRNPLTADVTSGDVVAFLERHAATLALLRRASDRPDCRFDRDWSRPSLGMLLPEVQSMREASPLLVLAARRAVADGDGVGAIADIVRVHRLGLHAASEPFLISSFVGQVIDRLALETLADTLPRLDKADVQLLDAEPVRDFLATRITYQRAFLCEEALGLATLGELADGARGMVTGALARTWPQDCPLHGPFSLLSRCFILPADIAGYREILRRSQAVVGLTQESRPPPYPTIVRQATAIESEVESRRAGFFAGLLAPPLAGAIEAQARGDALHDVAGVLVAATRARLAGTSIADALVPGALPRDPFTADQSLQATRVDQGWVVYSVGPDGEDDGGPPPAGVDAEEGNDDVGLRLAL